MLMGSWMNERLTPVERHALEAVAAAWLVGTVAGWCGWPEGLDRLAARWLDPPLPTLAELTAALPPGDLRPELYAAGLALREERLRAVAAPAALDPNSADRAEWDRLPGIGPRTAAAIVAHRARNGPFSGPEDLLEVRGIGPVTLDRLRPYMEWPADPRGGGSADAREGSSRPDLNRVDAAFLATLPGIGPKLASSIVADRSRRRGFRDWTEVLAVKGIGKAKLGILQGATRLMESRSGAPIPDLPH